MRQSRDEIDVRLGAMGRVGYDDEFIIRSAPSISIYGYIYIYIWVSMDILYIYIKINRYIY